MKMRLSTGRVKSRLQIKCE